MVKQKLSVFSAFEVYSSFSPKHLLHASVVNIMRDVRRWQWITARDDRIVTQDICITDLVSVSEQLHPW